MAADEENGDFSSQRQKTISPTLNEEESNGFQSKKLILDKNQRGEVLRKNNVVDKIFFRNHDHDAAMYHFKNEVRLLIYLRVERGHTFVPELYETETFFDKHIIKMEYAGIDLCNLYKLCNDNKAYVDPFTKVVTNLSQEWWVFNIKNFCEQIKNIVNTIHIEGVFHLDIKAENFVCNLQTHKVSIIDFANSIIIDDKRRVCDVKRYSIGTPVYMSPETVICGDRNKQSDIWAAAVTLYVLQTGRYLPGTNMMIIDEIEFEQSGDVCNDKLYRKYYNQILTFAKPYIDREYSYDRDILNLTKYFVTKELRPSTL